MQIINRWQTKNKVLCDSRQSVCRGLKSGEDERVLERDSLNAAADGRVTFFI